METLAKLYLELAHVVPAGTKTFREAKLERALHEALEALDDAGAARETINRLRGEAGWDPL